MANTLGISLKDVSVGKECGNGALSSTHAGSSTTMSTRPSSNKHMTHFTPSESQLGGLKGGTFGLQSYAAVQKHKKQKEADSLLQLQLHKTVLLTEEDVGCDSIDMSKDIRLFTEENDESVEDVSQQKAALLSAYSNSTADRQIRKATKTGVRKLKITRTKSKMSNTNSQM